jgi:predicted nucleotidyltransferase component of viral defense system
LDEKISPEDSKVSQGAMQDLISQERFEIEVLDRLNSGRFLAPLGFVGGTMLRLCCGSNRFSVDMDFWFARKVDYPDYFKRCRRLLNEHYQIRDVANKFHTVLFELTSSDYPRGLKIEMRKVNRDFRFTEAIAFSPYSDRQVRVKALSLKDMLAEKVKALLQRREIRDAFDLEFILRRGVKLEIDAQALRKVLTVVDSFGEKDYQVKLGSLLGAEDRRYYRKNRFEYLVSAIKDTLLR